MLEGGGALGYLRAMSRARPPLEDTVVLVTRPATRTSALCRRIREAGGRPVVLPALVVTALPPIKSPRPADYYIFLSAHAVEHGLPHLRAHIPAMNRAVVLAVGPATAAALNAAGIRNVETPPTGPAGSEGLLATPCLEAGAVQNRRVILICGVGGRMMLAKELRARGAQVERLEVYRREPAQSDIAGAIRAGGGRRPEVAVITSVEGMESLSRLIRTQRQEWLFAVPLVALSERIAAERLRCGFTAAAYIAPSAGDDGLVAALLEYARAERS